MMTAQRGEPLDLRPRGLPFTATPSVPSASHPPSETLFIQPAAWPAGQQLPEAAPFPSSWVGTPGQTPLQPDTARLSHLDGT